MIELIPTADGDTYIQQLDADQPVTELWEAIAGRRDVPTDPAQITLFDSLGFAVEDFSALTYVRTGTR